MPDIDRDMCRKAAAECIELARSIADPAKKEILLIRAQEWLKLAYSKNDTEFEHRLAQLNSSHMRRQPMQQQQSKIEPEDDK